MLWIYLSLECKLKLYYVLTRHFKMGGGGGGLGWWECWLFEFILYINSIVLTDII